MRRARKYLDGQEPTFSIAKIVDHEVALHARLGLVNDRKFARDRTRSMTERGNSPRKIEQWLRVRGCKPEAIDAALAEHRDKLELRAALRYARRRRLGPFQTDGQELDREQQQKAYAKMGRAGHSFSMTKSVFAMDREEAEELLFETKPGSFD